MKLDIRRPRILIKAAKIGLQYYKREKNLKILLKTNQTPTPETAIAWLVDAESSLNKDREKGAASYSLEQHIALLTALLNEMCLLERKAV